MLNFRSRHRRTGKAGRSGTRMPEHWSISMLQHTNIRGGKYFGSPIDRPEEPGFRQWPILPYPTRDSRCPGTS